MSKKHVMIVITLFFIGIAGVVCFRSNDATGEELIDCDTNDEYSSGSLSDELSDKKESKSDSVNSKDNDTNDNSSRITSSNLSKYNVEESIFVHVCGEVREPGVYELKNGNARVVDAIKAAKGLTNKASMSAVNQAEKVKDGQQIYIPSETEAKRDLVNSSTQSLSEDNNSSKININTASEEELDTLTGIGQAKARDIIDYRAKHGEFKKIEDIMNIPGIKEGLFNKISENITV